MTAWAAAPIAASLVALGANAWIRTGAEIRSSRAELALRALREPWHALGVVLALSRGWWYKLTYPLIGRRFHAGRGLRVYGRLSIRGPGEVVFGERVVVHGRATPWTHSARARIVVGDNVIMGHTAFACIREITIGNGCILARAEIQDTDFHSSNPDRHSATAPVRVAPVHIGDNVWIAQNAGILPGTRIGRDSVVSFGSVCAREYPEGVILVGNPARVVGSVVGGRAPAATPEP